MAAEQPRGSDGSPETEAARSDRLFVAGIFLLALAVRLFTAWASGVAAPQEIRYITIAQGILKGQGFTGIDDRFPDLIQPPLYPILLAGAIFVFPHPLAAARGLSAVMGALLIFPLSAIARRLFSRGIARKTAWLVAFYPLLVHISALCMTEPTFTFCVVVAVYCILRATIGEREIPNIAVAGLLLGLGFLTRPEGIADTAATSALLFYWAWRRRRLPIARAAGIAALPAIICLAIATPYWIWLHVRTGTWLLSPKVALTQVHQGIMNQGIREHWPEPYGTKLFYERVKFGLNERGTDLQSAEAFRALGLLPEAGVPEPRAQRAEGPAESEFFLRIILRNVKHLYLDTIKYGLVLPTLLLGFLVLGITSRPWRAGTWRFSQGILLWYALSGCSWMLSYVQPRFLYPSVVFLLPWIAEGWTHVEKWLSDSIGAAGEQGARVRDRIIAWGLTALVVVSCVIHLPPPVRFFSSQWAENRTAGVHLKETGAPPGPIMALTPVASFYAEFPFEMLPYADLDRVLIYARAHEVRYLLADNEFPTDRPQLMSLLDPEKAPPGLRVVDVLGKDPEQRVVIYALEPTPDERGQETRL